MSLTPLLTGESAGDLAAEYALGVLDAEEHRAAEARTLVDPVFASETLVWSERLALLLNEIRAEAPSPALWPRILARLHGSNPGARISQVSSRPADRGGAELRRKLAVWRATGLGALAASLALTVALGVSLSRPAPRVAAPPVLLVAELKLERGAPPLMAAYDPLRRAVLISLAGARTPPSRSPQLWVIDAAGVPRPLGLLKAGAVAIVALPSDVATRLQPAATLAISIEPLGGSPTGRPTGPVIAKGALAPA